MPRFARICFTAILLLFVLTQSGCIRKRAAIYGKYNDKSDSFSLLFVNTHYQVQTNNEIDWLVKRWEVRKKLIPLPGIMFTDNEIVRISNDSYRLVDFNSPGQVSPVSKTDIPLDSITITPGDFFVGPDGTLSITHRIELPGKIVDQLLQQQFNQVSVQLSEQAKVVFAEERKRRVGGGKVVPWEALRKSLRTLVDSKLTTPVPEGEPSNLLSILSEVSLTQLEKAAIANKLAIRRSGTTLSVLLPLSPEDGEELRKTVPDIRDALRATLLAYLRSKDPDLIRNALQATSRSKDPDLKLLDFAEKILGSISVAPADGGFTLSVKVPKELDSSLLLALFGFTVSDPDPNPEKSKIEQRNTLAAIRKKKVPVREDVKLDELITKFRAE